MMRRWIARLLGPLPAGDDRLTRWLAGLFVCGLVGFQLSRMLPSLWLPWFHKSDEMVYTWEVIRFLRLDFHQRWMGGPATPFMALTALLWSAGHRLLLLTGLTTLGSPSRFAFAHLDALHLVMRALSMSFYVGSVALTYLLGRRLTNVFGGCVAALLLVTLPEYCVCGQSARTETMGVFLTLAAVWWAYRGRETGRMKFYLWAGVAAGVATTARFHCALAALPVMLTIPLFYRPAGAPAGETGADPPATPRPYLYLAGAFAALFLAGALVVVGLALKVVRPGFVTHAMLVTSRGPDFPVAVGVMRKLWLALGTVCPALFAAYFVPRLRRGAAAVVNPAVITMLAAFAGGFLVSSPTFLWQGEYQLASLQFYGTLDDPVRARLGLAESWWQVTRYCFEVAQPEAVVGVALFLGVGLALWRRDRAFWPVVVGAVIAFAAQPPRMRALPHHVLPWMPFLALLPAYAAAVLYRAAGGLAGTARAALLLVLLGGALLVVRDRLPAQKVDRSGQFAKCRAITDMTRWMEQNTPPDADLYLSYDAFNEQTYYNWFESQAVAVPASYRNTTRHYHFWWNGRSELRGKSGYLAFAGGDLFLTDDLDLRIPGEGVDPYHESGFEPVQTFAADQPQVITVFRFDFREEKR